MAKTKVIFSRVQLHDQYLIGKAVLGQKIFNKKEEPYFDHTEEPQEDDVNFLAELLNETRLESDLSEDEQFAISVFSAALSEQSRLLRTFETVDFSQDVEFLRFWAENGQFLSWYLFSRRFPAIDRQIFDDLDSLTNPERESLTANWDQIAGEVFGLSQLYWSTTL